MMLRSVCAALAVVPPALLRSLCLHRGPGSRSSCCMPGQTPPCLPAPGGRAPGTLGPDGEAQGQPHADSLFSLPLPGLRSCCHPARSSHCPHLYLPGTAAQTFWDESDHLSRRDRTPPCPRGVSVRVTAETPEPLFCLGPAPFPLSPLLCLASACDQPVPDSPFLSHPRSQHLLPLGYSWTSCSPCTVRLGFFCCFPLPFWPRVLPQAPSALSRVGRRSRTALSRGGRPIWPRGAGGDVRAVAGAVPGRRGDTGSALEPLAPLAPRSSAGSLFCFPTPRHPLLPLAKPPPCPLAAGLFRDRASYQ